MKVTTLFLLFFLLSNIGNANERSPYSLSLGGGVAFSKNMRFDNLYSPRDSDPIISEFPLVQGGIGPLRIRGRGASLGLFYFPGFSPYLSIGKRGHRYYGPDGMDQRHDSWFFGFGARIYGLRVYHEKDIEGESGGHITGLNYMIPLIQSKVYHLRISLTAEYLSAVYTNYYYGVESHEVTETRSRYNPDGTWTFALAPFHYFHINESVSFLTMIGATFYGSQVTNSPTTISDSIIWRVILGLSFKVL